MQAGKELRRSVSDPMASLLEGMPTQVIARIRHGIPVSCLKRVSSTLGMDKTQFLATVGMSGIRVERRIRGKRVLTVGAGNILVRVAQVYRSTIEVYGNHELAGQWLQQELIPLGGVSPLSLCDTEFGADLVRKTLRAIEYGMPA